MERQPKNYRVTIDFIVARRVGWQEGDEELRAHLDNVVEALKQGDGVSEVAVTADLAKATLQLQLVLARTDAAGAEASARALIGQAIRSSGAMHEGLLSLSEESRAKGNHNAWWGLRTPKWHPKRVELTGG